VLAADAEATKVTEAEFQVVDAQINATSSKLTTEESDLENTLNDDLTRMPAGSRRPVTRRHSAKQAAFGAPSSQSAAASTSQYADIAQRNVRAINSDDVKGFPRPKLPELTLAETRYLGEQASMAAAAASSAGSANAAAQGSAARRPSTILAKSFKQQRSDDDDAAQQYVRRLHFVLFCCGDALATVR
jgi:hypothetical protein